MTITTDPTYDELGAEISPGTLCWVRTTDTVPPVARSKRCLAVCCGPTEPQHWLLLIPAGEEDPFTPSHTTGWRLRHNLTEDQMRRLNLERFVDSHRGWWVDRSDFQFIETAAGYWCVTHQVFHAADTCPPEEYGDTIARLERELAEAKEQVAQARAESEAALEAFKIRCSDILGDAANEHDLCGQYDSVCESAGLYPRMHNEDVEVEVTYRQTITVKARHYDDAVEMVEAKSATRYFEPGSPFADASDIEEHGIPYSLTVTIA